MQNSCIVIAGGLAISAVFLLGAKANSSEGANSTNWVRVESSRQTMGTTFLVTAYGPDRIRLEAGVEAAMEEAARLDALLSNYKPQSEWSIVNREAPKGPVRISRELFDLLSACQKYSELSEGAFDITVGPLMRSWGFFKGDGRYPHRSEIRVAMASVGYRNLILDNTNQTVRFRRPDTEIDPGGIGKGYAVDRMAQILREAGITSAFVSAGASSLFALGAPPDKQGWHVTIPHPKYKNRTVAEVYLKNQAMATSGSAEKHFAAGGEIYSHIMDPRTGYPAKGMLSVSLIAQSGIDTEAWAKPMYILGSRWASQHKPKGMRVLFCPEGPKGQRWETTCEWLQ